jgi:hypothetical protein
MEPTMTGSEIGETGGLIVRQRVGMTQGVNHDVGQHLGAGSQPHVVRTGVGPAAGVGRTLDGGSRVPVDRYRYIGSQSGD